MYFKQIFCTEKIIKNIKSCKKKKESLRRTGGFAFSLPRGKDVGKNRGMGGLLNVQSWPEETEF